MHDLAQKAGLVLVSALVTWTTTALTLVGRVEGIEQSVQIIQGEVQQLVLRSAPKDQGQK